MHTELRGLPAAVSRHSQPRHAAKTALTTNVAAPAVDDEQAMTVVKPVEEEAPATVVDNSRRHVQQSLHHLIKLVRHTIKDEMKAAGDMDHETMTALRDLTRSFRDDLHTTFHAAGSGNGFDRSMILPGIGEAVVSLTEGLRALRGADEEIEETPEIAPVPDEPVRDMTPETVYIEPGGLLETYV
jgi:hypothetical protein